MQDPTNVSISGLRSLARKLSTSSNRTLPPSYSKVDLTSVGLTLNDHLNPPPTYDRLIAMLESGEITSVPIHLHPEVERRMSMASTYSANNRSRRESNSSSRKSSKQSKGDLYYYFLTLICLSVCLSTFPSFIFSTMHIWKQNVLKSLHSNTFDLNLLS